MISLFCVSSRAGSASRSRRYCTIRTIRALLLVTPVRKGTVEGTVDGFGRLREERTEQEGRMVSPHPTLDRPSSIGRAGSEVGTPILTLRGRIT